MSNPHKLLDKELNSQDSRSISERWAYRPITASRPGTKKSGRGDKKTSFFRRKPLQNDSEGSFLARLKPRQIPMDKERLYEENMALKFQINSYKDEVLKLKTRVTHLEKELGRKEDLVEETKVSSKGHLVNGLKTSIRDLKTELRAKETQISKLKKNVRNTRAEELEIELKTYVDECSRLRNHLQESIKETTSRFEDKRDNTEQLLMKKDLEDLKEKLRISNDETRKWKEKCSEIEKKKKLKTKDTNEVKKLRAMLDSETKAKKQMDEKMNAEKERMEKVNTDLKYNLNRTEKRIAELNSQLSKLKVDYDQLQEQKNLGKPPQLFLKLNKILKAKGFTIKTFIEIIDKHRNGRLESHEFIDAMKNYGQKIKLKHVNETLKFITGKPTGAVPLNSIEQFYSKYSYDLSDSSSSSEDEKMKIDSIDKGSQKEKAEEMKAGNVSSKNTEIREMPRKDAAHKESYAKETIQNEPVPKETTKKDTVPKEPAKKDTVPKEAVKKDTVSKEPAKKDTVSKEPAKKDTVSKEPAKKDTVPKESVEKENASKKAEENTPEVLQSEVQDLLSHISLKMQIHRVPKAEMFKAITTSSYDTFTTEDIIEIFSQSPFSFPKSQELEKLAHFLLQGHARTADSIQEKINACLNEWKVFTTQNEEAFDQMLRKIIPENADAILELCTEEDSESTGEISLAAFKGILGKLNIKLPPDVYNYITLLFYSQNFKLNTVPYESFLSVYVENEYDADDEENAAIVRGLLEMLGQQLQGRSIRQVFRTDKHGLIPGQYFIDTIKNLGMVLEDENLYILMVEALQSEQDLEELCIEIAELEEIMEHYGVAKQQESSSDSYSEDEFDSKNSSESP